MNEKVYSENRKARFDYEILEKFTAGIELFGFEVKAIRAGQMSLLGSYIIVRGGEVYLVSSKVSPLQPKNVPADFDTERNRRLLLTKKEIFRLADYESKKGLTIIPLMVYNNKRKIKLDLAVVRGKKKIDKRSTIKERETEREIRRTLKNE